MSLQKYAALGQQIKQASQTADVPGSSNLAADPKLQAALSGGGLESLLADPRVIGGGIGALAGGGLGGLYGGDLQSALLGAAGGAGVGAGGVAGYQALQKHLASLAAAEKAQQAQQAQEQKVQNQRQGRRRMSIQKGKDPANRPTQKPKQDYIDRGEGGFMETFRRMNTGK